MHDIKPNSANWREQNKVTGGKRVREQPYDVNVEIIGCVRATLCYESVFLLLIGCLHFTARLGRAWCMGKCKGDST